MKKIVLNFLILIAFAGNITAQDSLDFSKTEIIYGRKDGMALTMLMLVPKTNVNGKAIIHVVSGNWISSFANANSRIKSSATYIQKGYTVFMVVHGSQPRYSIPDEIADVKRAVRFIRYNADKYKIDGGRLGITGASSGGHLSLMVGLLDDKIDTLARDPVDRVSSRVQAIAVFFPPTDFLNWGQQKMDLTNFQPALVVANVASAFDFKEWNDTFKVYRPVSTQKKLEIVKSVSPVYFVSGDDPPVMIAHGDADRTVPLQQSEIILQKLKDAKVANEFILKTGGGHGWRDIEAEERKFADWFDKYLK